MEGADLVPFATGKKSGAPHDVLFWRNRTRSNNYSARQGEWKFVHSTEGSEQPGHTQKPARDLLFNLTVDSGEQSDLAAQHPDKLAALKKRYEVWSAEVDADCCKLGIEPMGLKAGAVSPPQPQANKTKPRG